MASLASVAPTSHTVARSVMKNVLKWIFEELTGIKLCRHEWGKWEPYLDGKFFQRRTCKKCGYIQEKSV